MEPFTNKLTKEEKARNRHSECAMYSYDPDMIFTYTSSLPQLFPNIVHCHVRFALEEPTGVQQVFFKRKGIVVNDTQVLLYGQMLTGRKYVPKANGVVELEKQWAKQVLPFAYQTVVKDIKAFYSSMTCFKSLDELFTPSTTVFMVQDSQDVIKDGRIRVVFNVPHEPQLEHLIQNQHVRPISVKTWTCHFISGNVINPHSFMWIFQKYSVKYCPGYFLASRLGISSYLVSRFSGSIFIGRGSKKKFVSKCCLFFRNGGNLCSCAVFCTNQPL
ncbi:hypothetical protein GOODEAATRI_012499 [Goodea atripinnis]|uniref:Uncharacterized protein n=1 Tax=Goodea atripinnis TaxID=208336 RepID=A0ABV0NA39_9TELE